MSGLGELSTKARRYAVRLWLDDRAQRPQSGQLDGPSALLLALTLWGDEPDESLGTASFGGRDFPDDDTVDVRITD